MKHDPQFRATCVIYTLFKILDEITQKTTPSRPNPGPTWPISFVWSHFHSLLDVTLCVFSQQLSFSFFLKPFLSPKFLLKITAMERKITNFFDSVGTFFTGGDQIPWCDSDIVVVSIHLQFVGTFLQNIRVSLLQIL